MSIDPERTICPSTLKPGHTLILPDPDKSQNPVGDMGAGYNPLPLILIYVVLGYIGYKWGYKLGRGRHE